MCTLGIPEGERANVILSNNGVEWDTVYTASYNGVNGFFSLEDV